MRRERGAPLRPPKLTSSQQGKLLALGTIPYNRRRYRAVPTPAEAVARGDVRPSIEYVDGESGPAVVGDMRGARLLQEMDLAALVDYARWAGATDKRLTCVSCGREFREGVEGDGTSASSPSAARWGGRTSSSFAAGGAADGGESE